MNSLRVLFVLLGVCSPISVVFGAEAIISQTIHSTITGSANDQTLGWGFHLNSPVTLTALGVYDHLQDGFAEPHEVGLWMSSGTLLADGFLTTGTSGTLLNSFRYVDVPHVALPIGDYVLGAHFIGTYVDPFSDNNVSLTTDPFVEYKGAYRNGPGFQFPSLFIGSAEFNWITSNFQYDLVPEPTTATLMILGAIAYAFRRGRKTVGVISSRNDR